MTTTPELPDTTDLWVSGWRYDNTTGLVTAWGIVPPPADDPDPLATMLAPRPTFTLTFPADLTVTDPPPAPEQHTPED